MPLKSWKISHKITESRLIAARLVHHVQVDKKIPASFLRRLCSNGWSAWICAAGGLASHDLGRIAARAGIEPATKWLTVHQFDFLEMFYYIT